MHEAPIVERKNIIKVFDCVHKLPPIGLCIGLTYIAEVTLSSLKVLQVLIFAGPAPRAKFET